MPQDSNQKYYEPMGNRIVAVCIGGFISPVQPYELSEDELREMNDD